MLSRLACDIVVLMIEMIPGRLINLRKIRRADAASIAQHINDVTVARNTFVPHPYRLEDAHKFIRDSQKWWRRGTAYRLGIEDRETGNIIGGIGLEGISKKHRNAEAGYWLSRKFRGRGIASEALRLAVWFGFKQVNLVRIQAHVMTGNLASVVMPGIGEMRIQTRGAPSQTDQTSRPLEGSVAVCDSEGGVAGAWIMDVGSDGQQRRY